MKLFLYSGLCLAGVVLAAVAVGYSPTLDRWGAAGVDSMIAVAVICFAAAAIGAVPLVIVAPRWPDQIGQAVLGGTVIRLLLTMAFAGVYQLIYDPHLASFLSWATIIYLLLLTVETTFGVLAIRRFYRAPRKTEGTSA